MIINGALLTIHDVILFSIDFTVILKVSQKLMVWCKET